MRCLVAVLGLILASPLAHADDRTRAAEHFARAESAEQKGDHRAAIAEYQRAYALSPHPSVLYNIGRVSERMGAHREAATYFLRYLDESDGASDRDEVLAKVAALRKLPSKLTLTANPVGAQMSVDGKQRGAAPLVLELVGGEHTVTARQGSLSSPPRRVELAFGEPATVHIDLRARPGVLQVYADVDGAEVSIDGAIAGKTPLVTEVDAGPHEVIVRAPGRQIVRRQIDVPADGSQQIRASLAPLPGADLDADLDGTGGDDAPPRPGTQVLLGLGYGWQGDAIRYQAELGLRTAGERLDLSAFTGIFGGDLGLGVGAGARFFIARGKLRPYVRAAALLGAGPDDGSGRQGAVEGGVGVLLAPVPDPDRPSFGSIDYYLEISAQYHSTSAEGDDAVVFPIALGALWRLGG